MNSTIQETSADVFTPELPPSPYPGLRPFEKSEWPIFFGRERMTEEVINRLLERRLVVVHGASGGGKSSLVRAGVQARLEQQLARSGLRWRMCAMRPGSQPLANLTAALAGIVEGGASRVVEIRRTLNEGRQAPAALIKVLGLSVAERLCVLLDQFEELFRFAREVSQDESTLLTDFLVGFDKNPPDGIHVLVTMRSEFLGDCARYDDLAETINRTQYLLPRMTTDDLLRAVGDPATLYGGRVTDRLAERLIADARGDQDELPLIQHGLAQLWSFASSNADNESGPILDLAAYEMHGPLGRLLSEHADNVADAEVADSSEKTIIENLFRSLTEINVDGNAVRHPQVFKDLVPLTGATADQLCTILDRFRQPGVSFVTPYAPVPIETETTIDISHEALIRCWRRIADKETGWLQKEFRDGLIWRSLAVQTEAFAANPRNVLSEATTEARGKWLTGRNETWAKRYGNRWAEVTELLVASQREVERQRQRDEADRKNAEQARRRRFVTRALATFSVIVGCLAGLAIWQGMLATRQRAIAERNLSLATDAVNSMVLDVARDLRGAVGVPAATVERILNRALSLQDALRTAGNSSPELLRGKADALNETSQTSLTLGDTSRALDAASKAINVYRQLLVKDSDDSVALRGLSKAFSTAGDIKQAQGDFSDAMKLYQESLALAERLVASNPGNAGWQRDLSVVLGNIGDVQRTKGDFSGALESYQKSLAIAQRLADSDPGNAGWQRDLAAALRNIGFIQYAQGDLAAALKSYRESLALAERLVRSDPGNARWQRDLSFVLGNIGEVQRTMGDFPGALEAYQKSLAIAQGLAASDPGNAVWQRDRAVWFDRIGTVYAAQNDTAKAREALEAGRAIMAKLVALSPENERWKNELARFDSQITALVP
jgi:tetratricopeptide (TPR) repeat protein